MGHKLKNKMTRGRPKKKIEIVGITEAEKNIAASSSEIIEEKIPEDGDKVDKTKRFRGWCFTYNNWTVEGREKLTKWFKSTGIGVWYIFGEEVGDKTHTPHLQGAVYFKNKRCRSGIKKDSDIKEISWRAMNGTCADSKRYCSKGLQSKDEYKKHKDSGPNYGLKAIVEEWGKMPKQGKRVDIEKKKDQILAGETTVKEIAKKNAMAYHQHGRTFEYIENIYRSELKRKGDCKILWVWGPSGTGKSYCVENYLDENEYYTLNVKDGGFWNGYVNQKVVMIEEFRGGIEYDELLRLATTKNHTVKIKGKDPIRFTSEVLVITSPLHPRDVYHNRHAKDSLGQLLRRAKIVETTEGVYLNKNFYELLDDAITPKDPRDEFSRTSSEKARSGQGNTRPDHGHQQVGGPSTSCPQKVEPPLFCNLEKINELVYEVKDLTDEEWEYLSYRRKLLMMR